MASTGRPLASAFVVPIMFRRGGRCLQGWGVLLGLVAGNLGRFILYFLFQIVLALAIAVVVLTAVLAFYALALAWGYIMQKTDSLWGSALFHAGMDIPIMLGIFANLP